MNFKDCVAKSLVRKTARNKEMCLSLVKLAGVRLENAGRLTSATLKAESYYEILKELITALLSIEGYKSYSHECLVSFVREMFSDKFTGMQIELIDQLRIMRNDIGYRGIFVEDDFLKRNESAILQIINIMKGVAEERIK